MTVLTDPVAQVCHPSGDAGRAAHLAHVALPASRHGAARSRWWDAYATRILLTDAVAVYIAVFTAYVVRFGADGDVRVRGDLSPSYLAISGVLLWLWLFALVAGRTQDRRLIGVGTKEYQQVFSVTWRLFAAVAVLAYLLRMEIARGYLAIAFPVGLLLLLLGRYGWRRWLHARRRHGDYQSRVLVVGHRAKAEELVGELAARSSAGFGVVGVCLPEGDTDGGTVRGVPVLGPMADAADVARRFGVDAVTVVGADSMTADAVRRLGWDLEGSGVDLALTMSLSDVAGPRVIMQPVNGLPLVYVDEPRFIGPRYALKTVFDWLGALAITVLALPLLAVIAALVAVTSEGPVLYRQQRVGVGGKVFAVLKFRSMTVDAHDRLAEVLALEGAGEVGLFYKPKADPRVTRVGRVLRRYSLDELPQLVNVLRGEMSLVGPRPQIPAEVAQYDRKAHRRLLVKPGLTGLWQVSGRSDLTAEEGIRMDVYYVENWTLFGDVLLMARTAKALVSGQGAY